MIIILDSVGSVYDTEEKMTYAAYNEKGQKLYNRLYDEESGVPLNDCSEEWIDALSEEDVQKINEPDFFKD
jgi:lysophospholipase L1-like esterase